MLKVGSPLEFKDPPDSWSEPMWAHFRNNVCSAQELGVRLTYVTSVLKRMTLTQT